MSKETTTPTAAREMFCLCMSGIVWGDKWAGHHVRLWCDNKGDVDSFRKQMNNNALTLHFMRVLAYLSALHDFTFEVEWLKSADNMMADFLTRVSVTEFMQACSPSSMVQRETPILPPRLDDPFWEDKLTEQILQAKSQRK